MTRLAFALAVAGIVALVAFNWRTCKVGSAEISGAGFTDGDAIVFLRPWMRVPRADCR